MVEQVDVVVVGLGPGGEDVAGRLAQAGLSVVGVEQRLVGGECPYYGCVPSKMMIRAGNALAEARRVNALAGHAVVTPDWGRSRPGYGTSPPIAYANLLIGPELCRGARDL
jgi:pyruvate/2-oxoglutarate dehydrogenase complex dihydrolipoamide dehydrogenase (E3) component